MFPQIFLDTSVKRARASDSQPPSPTAPGVDCPDELRYERGRELSVSMQRVTGSSASFITHQLIEDEQLIPLTWKGMGNLWTGPELHPNTHDVVLNVYRPPTPAKPPTQKEGEALTRTAHFHPQYRLKMLNKPATLVHIIHSDKLIEDHDEEEESGLLEENRVLYTNGSIWTSTDPDWTWNGRSGINENSEKMFRCKILVPKGNQVVVDMSPVKTTPCRLDKDNTSVFPDVVLLPAKFVVTSVTRFYKEHLTSIEDEYVKKALESQYRKEFIDVCMTLEKGAVLPEKFALPPQVLESLRS